MRRPDANSASIELPDIESQSPEIQDFLLQLDDSDTRLQRLTEPRLRHLHGQDAESQQRSLQGLLSGSDNGLYSHTKFVPDGKNS